jgi:putative transposase
MTNHVHLVLETARKGGNLSEIMKGINLSYAQYYKKRYRHIGHFWQDRYKSIMISKDNYLLACGSYVDLNPVRAKIVEAPKDYKWSSYNTYAYGRKDSITDKHSIYGELSRDESDRRKKYREFVRGMLRERDAMKGEMNRRVVYGSDDFIDKVTEQYKIGALIKPIGRPRKDEDRDRDN